ncbi:MAG: hypothetical protein J6B12_06215 [Clostridia bacterium]|nr:hypothetical protein [Clostridia bacterium]
MKKLKTWKKVLIVLSVLAILILLFFLGSFIAFKTISAKIQNSYITVACAKVAEDGSFEWEDEDRNSVWNYYPYDSLVLLFTAQTDRVEATLGDVELAEFRFYDKDFHPTYTFYIAYDYALKNVYIQRNNKWFRLKDTDIFDTMITVSIENCMSRPETWRVQSLYGLENWARADLDNLVFRYSPHWGCSYKPSAEFDYRDSGFKNIHPTVIETKDQAVARAAEELGYENPVGVVFYDKTCGYWMVELYEDPPPNTWADLNEYTRFLFYNVYTVIMDNQGITLETYQNVSHYKPFLEIVNYLK